jgi:hypothetical protein
MYTAGLPLDQFLKFCDTPTNRTLRRTSSQLAAAIPIGWTRPFIFVTDREDKHGLPFAAFVRYQSTCTHVDELVFSHVLHQGPLVLSPALTDLSELQILHGRQLTEVRFDTPSHRKLTSVLIYHCPYLTRVRLPPQCPHLMELSLSNLNLTTWTFSPDWRTLRVIGLWRVGQLPRVVLPATYTQLDTLQLSRLGLRELVLEMALSAPLRLYLYEPNEELPIRIRTAPANRQWCTLQTSVPIVWDE